VERVNLRYKIEHALSSRVIDVLESYSWPGNVRELENIVERMVLTAESYVIDVDSLPSHVAGQKLPTAYSPGEKNLKEILTEVERQLVSDCYEKYKTTTKVAEVLGISQPSASIKINKYVNHRGA
jgi:transcriptional regulator with PAS, ATPase and Fis domain